MIQRFGENQTTCCVMSKSPGLTQSSRARIFGEHTSGLQACRDITYEAGENKRTSSCLTSDLECC